MPRGKDGWPVAATRHESMPAIRPRDRWIGFRPLGWSANAVADRRHWPGGLRTPGSPARRGHPGALPGARPPPAGRPARAGADRARRPRRPAVVSQRDARGRHGRASRRRDPRPAARVDRGARRDRHMAHGASRRARGRRALRVLLRALRLHPHRARCSCAPRRLPSRRYARRGCARSSSPPRSCTPRGTAG